MIGWTSFDCGFRDTSLKMCGRDFECHREYSTGCNEKTGTCPPPSSSLILAHVIMLLTTLSGQCQCGAGFTGRACDQQTQPLGTTSIGLTKGAHVAVTDNSRCGLQSAASNNSQCRGGHSPISFELYESFTIEVCSLLSTVSNENVLFVNVTV